MSSAGRKRAGTLRARCRGRETTLLVPGWPFLPSRHLLTPTQSLPSATQPAYGTILSTKGVLANCRPSSSDNHGLELNESVQARQPLLSSLQPCSNTMRKACHILPGPLIDESAIPQLLHGPDDHVIPFQAQNFQKYHA